MNNRDKDVPTEETDLEARLQARGLNAPRITPDHINTKIKHEHYYVFPGTTLTVCALELENGFVVTGESAAASPANFNADIGREIAFRNARDKIWSLEGYLLREKLHEYQKINQRAQEIARAK